QPFRTLSSRSSRFHVDECEIAFQSLPMKSDFEIAFFEHGRSFHVSARQILAVPRLGRERLPGAQVPHHDRSRTIIALGNDSLKVKVGDGMILYLHGQAFVVGIKRWTFGHSPRLEHTFHLQAEVVVQTGGPVTLHDKTVPGTLLEFGRWFRSFREASFTFVLFEAHQEILNAGGGWPEDLPFARPEQAGLPVSREFRRPYPQRCGERSRRLRCSARSRAHRAKRDVWLPQFPRNAYRGNAPRPRATST